MGLPFFSPHLFSTTRFGAATPVHKCVFCCLLSLILIHINMLFLKGVLFDFDGTLADTLPLCIEAFRRAIEPYAGRALSEAEIVATFGPSEEGTIQALAPASYEVCLTNYLHYYERLHDQYPEAFEGIHQLLHELKQRGIRIGLVTGKGSKSATISLKKLGLESYFEFIQTGSPQGPRKAEGIRHILDEWKIMPQEAVYIGDAPSDVIASREVGIRIVSVAWSSIVELEALQALKPDALVHSVPELKALLRQWL